MTKKRAHVEGLSVPATIETEKLAKDTLVAITGDRQVDEAGADDVVVGRVLVSNRVADGEGTIETRFKELIEITASGAVAAGDFTKMAAAASGVQRMAKWDPAADDPETRTGLCWKGGADTATIEVLTYI